MKGLIQRVSHARVTVESQTVGAIQVGLLVLVGIERDDGPSDVQLLADKLPNLRIFEDDEGKMNRSTIDVGGSILLVPNFTLAGDCRKGRRPSFDRAMPPGDAEPIFEQLVERLRLSGVPVETGRFGAHMHVELLNEGRVTLRLDSRA